MAFVMDPLERISVDKDTTFVLMLEAQRRGHEVWYGQVKDLFVINALPHARLSAVSVSRGSPHYSVIKTETIALNYFDVIWMRKDPPFNLDYIYATYILGLADKNGTLVINNPRGIRESNEKLYTLHFPALLPETLVSKDASCIKEFLRDVGGEIVVKPLDSCGGEGVFYLREGDKNINVILENATKGGEVFVMAQRFISEVVEGDKRIILLDGEPIGAVLRVSKADDFRCNFHSGGRAEMAEITDRDMEICSILAPKLRQDGLYFVGIDVIGGYLTEINTTSPTGVQEINRFCGVSLEAKVMDFVERRCS